MQPSFSFSERDSVTRVYFKPTSELQAWPAPVQYAPPAMRRPVVTKTEVVSRPSRVPIIGIGFAGVCVLVGITLGCVISGGSGSSAVAAPPVAKRSPPRRRSRRSSWRPRRSPRSPSASRFASV